MTRWTDADLATLQKRKAPPVVSKARGYRSALEAEYAGQLELRKRAGDVTDYGYERITLRLPGGVRYTPDFDVLRADGAVELHEVKGWLREVARDRLRSAVATYPGFEWWICGTDKVARRLMSPTDVPSARRVVK